MWTLRLVVTILMVGLFYVKLHALGPSWEPSGTYGYGVIGADLEWCDWKAEMGVITFSKGAIQNSFSETADKCPGTSYCVVNESKTYSYTVSGASLVTFSGTDVIFSKDDSFLLAVDLGFPFLATGIKRGTNTPVPSGEYYLMSYEKDHLGGALGENRLSMGTVTFSDYTATTSEKLACNGNQCKNGYYSGKSDTFSFQLTKEGSLNVCMKKDAECEYNEFTPFGHVNGTGNAVILSNAAVSQYTASDFLLVVGLKKADKQYSNADLEGKWVISGFGDEEEIPVGMLGVINCDVNGSCKGIFKKISNNTQTIEAFSQTFSVDQSGSINEFEKGPDYNTIRGAIGNNGNTIFLGIGRIMMVGVKTDAPFSMSALNLKKGWNLVGLISDNTKSVIQLVQGKEDNIASVWKWNQSKQKWAVYLPQQEKQQPGTTATYAGAKGFEVISNINPGEGFWVNVVDIKDDETISIDY